jgi:hypothetical protein
MKKIVGRLIAFLDNDIWLDADQLGRKVRESIILPLCPSVFDGDGCALDMAQFTLTSCFCESRWRYSTIP